MTTNTKPLRIHLIRHGETEWSLSGQHTGTTDISLTARGEDEARDLAHRLRGISFTRVLSSPLRRARRTCELAIPDVAPEIEADLAEWDYGDYEGLETPAILRARPGWNLFLDGGLNGETPAQVSDRADRLIARLRKMDGNVAVFSHGHFGRVLATRWIGLPVSEAEHFLLGTASVSIFGYDPHHPDVAVIERWNAISKERIEPENSPAIERWENEGGEIPDQQMR